MSVSKPRIGNVQYRILQVLWERGPCTARQITDALSLTPPLAHSTVQTLLRQLEAKGYVGHDVQERVFLYQALIAHADIKVTPLQELLMGVYEGSVFNLMSHLLRHEKISPEELSRLRQLLDEENKPDEPTS